MGALVPGNEYPQWIWDYSKQVAKYRPDSFLRPLEGDTTWEIPGENVVLYLDATGYDEDKNRFEKLPHYDLTTKVASASEKEFICMKEGKYLFTYLISPSKQ